MTLVVTLAMTGLHAQNEILSYSIWKIVALTDTQNVSDRQDWKHFHIFEWQQKGTMKRRVTSRNTSYSETIRDKQL